MNRTLVDTIICCLIILIPLLSMSQSEIIEIEVNNHPKDIIWENVESEYYNETWSTQTVVNVSKPTMEVFIPDENESNGTSVVICPGGGMYLHSIESEGNEVAKWFSARGITAFVLKYRLVPTGENAAQEFGDDQEKALEKAANMLSYSYQDAQNAIEYIRTNAKKYKIDPNKIGLMGFSAGGAVTMEATYKSNEKNRPNFIAPIYPWMIIVKDQNPPSYNPPVFVLCASDDPLDLAESSVKIYSDWMKNGATAELHMYSQGGHGFGMKKNGLPSDNWIERMYDWMVANKIVKK